MASTTLEIVALAAGDAVNPLTIAPVMTALLTHPGIRAAAAFSGAQAALNVGVGVLIVAGLNGLGDTLVDSPVLAALACVLGLALVLVGAESLRRGPRAVVVPRLLPEAVGAALVVAAAVYAMTLPFAGQMFLAMATISTDVDTGGAQLALVALYNVVYTAPLWALIAWRRRRGALHLTARTMRRVALVGDVLLLGAGLLLILTGAARL